MFQRNGNDLYFCFYSLMSFVVALVSSFFGFSDDAPSSRHPPSRQRRRQRNDDDDDDERNVRRRRGHGDDSGESASENDKELPRRSCHCRSTSRGRGISCTRCHEFYHTTCVLPRNERANPPNEYVCSHCQDGSRPVGFVAENVDEPLLTRRAECRYRVLSYHTNAELRARLTETCSHNTAHFTPKSSTPKPELIRMLMFAEYRRDNMTPPPPDDGLGVYRLEPLEHSVARRLFDDLLALAEEFPSHPLGLRGLLPHVMKHLRNTHNFHVRFANGPCGRLSVRLFARKLVGGVRHWQGIHEPPQCKAGVECITSTPWLRDVPANVVDRVRSVLVNITKQYAGRLASDIAPPGKALYIAKCANEHADDWYVDAVSDDDE